MFFYIASRKILSAYNCHDVNPILVYRKVNSINTTNTIAKAYEYDGALNIPIYDAQHSIFYPNPSAGIFNYNPELNFDSITLYDITGKELKSIYKEAGSRSFDLSAYHNGVYIAVVNFKEKQQRYKIILNR